MFGIDWHWDNFIHHGWRRVTTFGTHTGLLVFLGYYYGIVLLVIYCRDNQSPRRRVETARKTRGYAIRHDLRCQLCCCHLLNPEVDNALDTGGDSIWQSSFRYKTRPDPGCLRFAGDDRIAHYPPET